MRRFTFVVFSVALLGCGPGGWGPGNDEDAATSPTKNDASVATNDASSNEVDAHANGDAGISDALVADDTDYNTPNVCTSNTMWTLGDTKSANMHPGVGCRTCHVVFGSASGKDFDISGTVYPTAHEPNDCNGASGNMTVVITDAKNADHVLTVNSVGNFYNDDALGFLKIPTPYTAKVVSGNKSRAMITSQTNGDCNSCHTESGTQSAPGRIMSP